MEEWERQSRKGSCLLGTGKPQAKSEGRPVTERCMRWMARTERGGGRQDPFTIAGGGVCLVWLFSLSPVYSKFSMFDDRL